MAGLVEGKVALVTGAASGIGRATALAFAGAGARVVVADIEVEGGHETVRRINDAGGQAIFVRCDVSQASEVEALVERSVAAYGRLDCAFNNAGIGGMSAPTADWAEDVWERVINTNLKGVWLCMKYEISQMLRQGGGAIVNTASQLGLVGREGMSAYIASKHGVIGLTRTAALEYAQAGIRVNAVCPGPTDTPILRRPIAGRGDPETAIAALASLVPLGRLGRPEEIAAAVVWLCSDSASFVTGHPMVVDGGYIAQ